MRCVGRQNGDASRGLETDEDLGLRVRRNEPLSRHSSLRIGGDASIWAEVGTERALRRILRWADRRDAPLHVVGLGSNVVFPDDGLSGVTLKLVDGLADWEVDREAGDDAEVRVGGGTVNAHLVRGLLDRGWVGAEFLRLVPGTFGGAVAMNAGTKEKELEELLQSARVASLGAEGLRFETRDVEDLGLAYRHSEIGPREIVVEGRIRVSRGDVERAREKMEADRERRDSTQPYKLASAGSTFANPEGDYAGRLIDEVGLKGSEIGGARISETHANFFINDGDATARDFLALMALARRRVRETFGVELRPEVDFVGFDGIERIRELEQRDNLEGDGC